MVDESEQASWVERAASGDQPAVDRLLAAHLTELRAFVRLRMSPELRARESGSDIVQSVCRELLANDLRGFEYRGDAALRGWLYTAALNKIRKKARWHRGHAVEKPEDGSYSQCCATLFTPSQQAMGKEALGQLEAAFDRLPEHYREVITLARIAQLSHREIAERTGRSEEAARQLLHRAMAALTSALAESGLLP